MHPFVRVNACHSCVILFHRLSNVSVNGCPVDTPSDACRGKGAYWAPQSKRVGPKTAARNVSFPCRFHPKFGFALNASPLRFMVIESCLTHIYFLDALLA